MRGEFDCVDSRQYSFYPYESNGGSVVAISGTDFAVIAADSRLSSGYSIHTRKQCKLFTLSDTTVLGSTGCWCDTLSLTSLISARMKMYHYLHQKVMSTNAVAQMISIVMYHKRFFPYYVSNIVAGLDADGKGIVYSYDPIGHCEIANYRAGGSAGALLQPVLDSLIGFKNRKSDEESITLDRAISIITDTFISAAERDIYTGDAVVIKIINKDGIASRNVVLRKD